MQKEDIKPFYLNNEIDKFFSNIYTFQYIIYGQIHEHWNIEVLSKKEIKKRRYKEWNEKEKIIDYKTIIYSLSDFNATSTYILQNNANLMEKYHWEDKTPLSIYASYLKVIKYLYHYIKQRKSHKYGVNIIEEYQLSEKEKIKLNDIKNNINLNQIIQEIIKAYEKLEMNKNDFFNCVVKWINNYINSKNEIMIEYNKLLNEDITIISFFHFLELNCNIIIKTIDIFNIIKEILTISKNLNGYLYLNDYNFTRIKMNLEYVFNPNKIISKNNYGDFLFKLGNDIINKSKLLKEGYDKNKDIIERKYTFYFYYDEEKEKFL